MPTFAHVDDERVAILSDLALRPEKSYVLYWMQQSQRVAWNHALAYALRLADEQNKPLVVGFGLMPDYPGANLRHYTFMLEGLQETARELEKAGCRFILRLGSPEKVAIDLAKEAVAIVCDRGYLRHQRLWRRKLARAAECRVVQVESDAVVPVETASGKQEYAARTIRRKLMGQFEEFLDEPDLDPPKTKAG